MSSTSDDIAQPGVQNGNSPCKNAISPKEHDDGLSLSLPRLQGDRARRPFHCHAVDETRHRISSHNSPDASNGDLQFIDDVEELKFALAQERSKNLALTKEIQNFKKTSAALSVEMEEEEEFLTNRFIRRLAALRKEKETLMKQVEQEEEMLTNRLQRKLQLVLQEKQEIENQLEAEQEYIANRLSHQLLETKNENFELQLQREAQRIESAKLIRQLEAERELNKRSSKLHDYLTKKEKFIGESTNDQDSECMLNWMSVSVADLTKTYNDSLLRHLNQSIDILKEITKCMETFGVFTGQASTNNKDHSQVSKHFAESMRTIITNYWCQLDADKERLLMSSCSVASPSLSVSSWDRHTSLNPPQSDMALQSPRGVSTLPPTLSGYNEKIRLPTTAHSHYMGSHSTKGHLAMAQGTSASTSLGLVSDTSSSGASTPKSFPTRSSSSNSRPLMKYVIKEIFSVKEQLEVPNEKEEEENSPPLT